MSYKKMMKWNKKHPKGTRQTVIMHTNSGFTPSFAFLEEWYKYVESCKEKGIVSLSCEDYYKIQLR